MHTLQTGWCRYAGQDGAKRTNVWLLTQSPRAMNLVASGQAVAGPPTPENTRPRLALPGGGFGAGVLPRALTSPHQVQFPGHARVGLCTSPLAHVHAHPPGPVRQRLWRRRAAAALCLLHQVFCHQNVAYALRL